VFLTTEGVIESFPLPGGLRRWVVGGRRTFPPSLTAMVRRHTGCALAKSTAISRFAAEHYRAQTLVHERALLAGDAAHVISPIGGQGMNLGWLNAQLLCEALCMALDTPRRWPALGHAYDCAARAAARRAKRRSEIYLRVVRRGFGWSAEHWFVRLALTPPFKPAAARLFAMHGIQSRSAGLQNAR
jgi:2-polyprenyl-6-methoxyphenol hydroxylase-like FAD-dependent oxidoreductase